MIRSPLRPLVVIAGASAVVALVYMGSLSGNGEAPIDARSPSPEPGVREDRYPVDPVQVDRQQAQPSEPSRGAAVQIERTATKITVQPVDRSGRPLTREDVGGVLVLCDSDGVPIASGRIGDAPVLLAPRGEASGGAHWVALETSREERPWFVDPHQPGAMRQEFQHATGVRLEPGVETMDLVLAPGGSLSGRVQRDRGATHRVDWVRVRALGQAAPAPTFVQEGVPIDAEGHFEFPSLDENLYEVQFLVRNAALHRIENVQVRLGESCADPRLVNVDLGAMLQELVVEVVDEALAPLPAAHAVLRVGTDLDTLEPDDDGLRVPLPAAAGSQPFGDLALYVRAEGFLPVEIDPVPGHRTVVLFPLLAIQTQASEYIADVGSHGYLFRLRHTDAPPGSRWLWSAELPFDSDDGRAKSVGVPGPGRYELEVLTRVRMGSRFGSMAGERYQPTGVFLQVSPGGGLVSIPIPEDLTLYHPEVYR